MSKISAFAVLFLLLLPFSAHALDSDGRLSQTVTYQAKRKSVSAILQDLSNMTGVTFKAGMCEQDWQVRDRKMNIFVKDLPLSNLMNSIARVMKFKWSEKQDDDTTYYRLYMDRNTLLGVERERLIQEEHLRKQVKEGREKLAEDLDEAANMSEDQLEDLKTDSPYIYQLMTQGPGKVLAGVFSEIPGAKQAWLAGQEVTLDNRSMSPEQQQKVAAALAWKEIPDDVSVVLSDIPSQYGSSAVAADIGSASFLVNIGNGQIVQQTVGCFWNPDSEVATLFAKLPQITDQSELEVMNQKIGAALNSEVVDFGESLTDHSNDPRLTEKVKLKVANNEYADLFASLAQTSHYNVVSDSLDTEYSDLTVPNSEIELQTLLVEMETICRYNWEKHSSTLEFRDRDWFRKRSDQIPEARLEKWRKAYKENGLLDLNDLSEIASLTGEQYYANVRQDDVLAIPELDDAILDNHRNLLKLYAVLGKEARSAIFTEQGLDLRSRATGKQTALDILMAYEPATRVPSDPKLRLVGRKEVLNKKTVYNFSVITGSGESTGLKWTITCPTYTPPE